MNLRLKIDIGENVDEKVRNYIDTEIPYNAKLTTNKLTVEMDRNNPSEFKSIKNTKMIFDLEDGGILILIGNLSCLFRKDINLFGGGFFVNHGFIIESGIFADIKGITVSIIFSERPDSIEIMKTNLRAIVNDSSFQFNISQFDDFMDIFGYYKKLSEELNNNASFPIKRISEAYYFAPVDLKELYNKGELSDDYNTLSTITDFNGIIKGYNVPQHTYELMNNDLKDHISILVDIDLENNDYLFRKIQSMKDNLYVSDYDMVSEKNSDKLVELSLINILRSKTEITLSVEYEEIKGYKYLNVYDMGQKIKIDSIDESLKLINQGASGSAIKMIEYLIGNAEMPNLYVKTADISKRKYLLGLNESQKQAFLHAVDGSPVMLIKGPPGTGKTHVINAITQYITKELKEKVVIASQTHVAIDNVLDKLMENYDLVIPRRITNRANKYSDKEIDFTLYKTWASKFDFHNSRSTNRKLRDDIAKDIKRFKGDSRFKYSDTINSTDYSVIGATTTTSAIAGKKGLELLKEYKWLIIDEVSKSPITEVLRYLPYVEKIIMVGDDFQLAPLLEFTKEDVKDLPSFDSEKFNQLETVYQKSIFADTIKKAEQSGRLVLLNENYRSVKAVLDIYNKFYDNSLINRRESINPNKVSFSEKLDYMDKWDTFFVEVKGGKEMDDTKSHSRFNIEELRATGVILKDLVDYTENPEKVTLAAIFPYAAQIERFTKEYRDLINEAKKVFKSFNVDTVDAFQGKESDIVLVNTVVTDASRKNFLNDFRRINVSMSRAKDKLIIFGNSITLSKIEMKILGSESKYFLRDIIGDIKTNGKYIEYTLEGGIIHENTSKGKIKTTKIS